jgi:very-short-patch-repair endonuclease
MKRPPGLTMLERPRKLRREATEAERLLWSRLRASQLGAKFRRQMWLGGFIADFASIEAQLVVEVDGSQHAEQDEYDTERTREMERLGYRVLRFWNNEVLGNLDGVIELIQLALPSPSHAAAQRGPLPLPQRGEGQ